MQFVRESCLHLLASSACRGSEHDRKHIVILGISGLHRLVCIEHLHNSAKVDNTEADEFHGAIGGHHAYWASPVNQTVMRAGKGSCCWKHLKRLLSIAAEQ